MNHVRYNVVGYSAAAIVATPLLTISPVLGIAVGMACGSPNGIDFYGMRLNCKEMGLGLFGASTLLVIGVGCIAKKVSEICLNQYFQNKVSEQQDSLSTIKV